MGRATPLPTESPCRPTEREVERNVAIMAHSRTKRDMRANEPGPVRSDPRFWVAVSGVILTAARLVLDWFR